MATASRVSTQHPGSLAENVDERVGPVGTGELWGASGGWQLLPAQPCPFCVPLYPDLRDWALWTLTPVLLSSLELTSFRCLTLSCLGNCCYHGYRQPLSF